MRHSLLAAALALALATLPTLPAAKSNDTAAAAKRSDSGVWIVDLVDAPLASFRGSPKAVDAKGQPLAPTDIAVTGARKLDAEAPGSKAYLAWLEQRQDEFLAAASERLGRALVPRFRYKVLGNGMALRLDADEAAQLAALPGVAGVQREEVQHPMTDAGPAWIGAEAVWNGTVQGSNVRTRGEGVVIGVIDTGINATHPSFADVAVDGYNHANARGRFYGLCLQVPSRCNEKLIGIYDMTEEGARDGRDTNGHGTHVSSTAGGNVIDSTIVTMTGNIPLRVSGVAPRVNVISYKACIAEGNDGRGSCPGSATRAALEQAIVDQVDVVNYSIGGDPFDPWNSVRNATTDQSEVFLNARFAGVVNVVAAGNDGPTAGSVSSPSNSPWVLSVANVSHDRRFGNRLENLTGPGVPAGTVFEGVSLTGASASNARVVNGADFGFPLCSRGSDLDFPPTGASNPFPAGTFNGEIVLCQRGVQSRVAKGFNVRAGGAAGMVLYNDPANADALVSDDHFLAATHIGNAAGVRLAQLLAAARSQGGEVRGTLTATQSVRSGSGDVLSGDSGRGPVQPTGGYQKPDIAAPGTSIIAADEGGNGLASLSGTSMATPHVTGAAALLVAANPSWNVAQVESALRTSALDDVVLPDGVTRATARDAGAGRTRVDAAVRAGLYFNITRDQFVAADPQSIATAPGTRDPRNLNLPSLVDQRCFESCTFTRTVTALVDGAWRFSAPADGVLRVTAAPEQFTLSSGQSQVITFTVDAGHPDISNRWAETRVQLVPQGVNPPAVPVSIPVSVFADPGNIPKDLRVEASATHGFKDFTLGGLRSLSNAAFPSSDLVRLESETRTLPVDPTEDDPYDLPSEGAFVKLIDLPTSGASTPADFGFVVEANSGTARDIDLYVGVDQDGDRTPDAAEEVCRSTSSTASESCAAIYTHPNGSRPNTVWILVQNFAATQAAGDAVVIRSAALPAAAAGAPRLAASGPGVAGKSTAVPLRVSWSEPRMLRGETWVGFTRLQIGSSGGAAIPVYVSLASAAPPSPIVMLAKDSETLSLAAGAAHDRIVVDVPPNATSMVVATEGTGEVDLYLARDTSGASGPDIGTAPPRNTAVASSVHAGAGERIELSGAALVPGRWFLTPANAGSGDARLTLSVDVVQGGSSAAPGDNGYFNPARSGHGVYFHQIGELWAVIWYTYLQDGTPAWYIATGPRPAEGGSVWSAPLLRFTWNGSASRSTAVGEAMVTVTGSDRFVFSWQLDGTFGSEPLQPTGVIACAPVTGSFVSVAGSWYAPALPGYGFNILTTPNSEAAIAYLYDTAGNPRWLLGATTNPGRGVIELTQYTGFCPSCAFSAIQGTVAGPLTRGYSGPGNAQSAVNVTYRAPVSGQWNSSNDIAKLTSTLACQQ